MAQYFMEYFSNKVKLPPDAIIPNFKLQKRTLYKNVLHTFANHILKELKPVFGTIAYKSNVQDGAKVMLDILKKVGFANLGNTLTSVAELKKLNSGDLVIIILAESSIECFYFWLESLNDKYQIGVIDKREVPSRDEFIRSLFDYLVVLGYKSEPFPKQEGIISL